MILTALNDYYLRLREQEPDTVPEFGFSQEKISYALVLTVEGRLVDIQDIRDTSGKKPTAQLLIVPQSSNRSGTTIKPFFLWDKAEYVLGILSSQKNTLEGDKRSKEQAKAIDKCAAFRELHQEALSSYEHPLVLAVLTFLQNWQPSQFESLAFASNDVRDCNLVFKLDGANQYLHQIPEAKAVWQALCLPETETIEKCLVTGEDQPVARIHPAIKAVWGAQSSGASIVSFNKNAFESYGKSQGDNSPISAKAAFGYTTVLNRLLQNGSRQCLHLGDTSMVFWAEAADAQKAQQAEDTLAAILNPPATDSSETQKLGEALRTFAQGTPVSDWDPELEENTGIYVLGLAPNASRLSIRYWETGTLQMFAERLGQHHTDLLLDPLPWKTTPSVWRLLLQTVPHREGRKPKSDDIPPHLGGEIMRAILTGGHYPRSLLANLIMRMRADGHISGLRVALCKAVLVRDQRLNNIYQQEIPMSLDANNTDPGYLLGRLFAAFESVQQAALGDKVNSTIRDKYYGSASATPGSVFPVVVRNGQNHLSRLRKDKPGLAINIEKAITEIVGKLNGEFPKSLRIESQGKFAIGYYHQRNASYKSEKTESKPQGDDA